MEQGPLRILIVEDSPTMRALLVSALDAIGSPVKITEVEGKQAMAKQKSIEEFHTDRANKQLEPFFKPEMTEEEKTLAEEKKAAEAKDAADKEASAAAADGEAEAEKENAEGIVEGEAAAAAEPAAEEPAAEAEALAQK